MTGVQTTMRRILPLSATLLVTACAAELDAPPGPDGIEGRREAAYIDLGAWPNPEQIPVCWLTPGRSDRKDYVRRRVEEQFEGRPEFSLDFVGWGPCGAHDPSRFEIRIEIDDVRPSSQVGPSRFSPTMTLNFDFHDWNSAWTWCDVWNEEGCTGIIAVHEFGHALGLAHEQNRDDTPGWCDDQQGSQGDVFVGPWDEDSVMNYCNDDWSNGGHLSRGDIAGLARLYGGPGDVFVTGLNLDGRGPNSTLKAHNGFCLGDEVCEVGDVDGDGNDDVVAFTRGARRDVFVALADGDGKAFDGNGVRWHADFCGPGDTCLLGDVIGDGTADIVSYTGRGDGEVFVAWSDGHRFRGNRWRWATGMCGARSSCLLADVNQDGRVDLVETNPRGYGENSRVRVAHSLGLTFDEPYLAAFDFCAGGQDCEAVDFDGDGAVDLLSFDRFTGDVAILSGFIAPNGRIVFGASGLPVLDGFCTSGDCTALRHDPALQSNDHGIVRRGAGIRLYAFDRGPRGSVRGASFVDGAWNTYEWRVGACLDDDVCRVGDVNDDNWIDVIAFTRGGGSGNVGPGPVVIGGTLGTRTAPALRATVRSSR